MIPRAIGRTASRRTAVVLVALALAVGFAACDRVPLTAPTESTIALFATGSSVPANGSVDIVATVTESAGTPVQNGTVVTFTTTLGTISPAEARTNSGKVTVKLSGDGRSGTASIVAFSGGTKSDALEIPIGGAAADNIVLLATPSSVPAGGGSVQVTAQVRDASGNSLAGVPVSFTTTAGTLAQSSVTTDTNGQAATTLTTTRDADVTARAGGKEATLSIKVSGAPTIEITVSPTSPTSGQPVVFTITLTAAENGSPVQSMSIDFGDGSRQTLGTGSTTVGHSYDSAGTYTVTVRVRDTAGQETTQVAVVVVSPPTTIPVTVTVNTLEPVAGQPVGFTVGATAVGSSIDHYEWDFGDKKTASTTGPTTTHVYASTGTYIVNVHVFGADGSEGYGQTSIVVAAAP